jgi:F-type H+-transporting ATPase subunit gamma
MAKARALDKRRKSIRNIRKITRTMELIATARYKKAMDRATAATAYTRRITQVVADLARGLVMSATAARRHDETNHAVLLCSLQTGACGIQRQSARLSLPLEELKRTVPHVTLKSGSAARRL